MPEKAPRAITPYSNSLRAYTLGSEGETYCTNTGASRSWKSSGLIGLLTQARYQLVSLVSSGTTSTLAEPLSTLLTGAVLLLAPVAESAGIMSALTSVRAVRSRVGGTMMRSGTMPSLRPPSPETCIMAARTSW